MSLYLNDNLFAECVDAQHMQDCGHFNSLIPCFGTCTFSELRHCNTNSNTRILHHRSIHLLTSLPVHATSRRRRSIPLTGPLVSESHLHSHRHHRHRTRNFTPKTFRSVNRSHGSDVPDAILAPPLCHSHGHHSH